MRVMNLDYLSAIDRHVQHTEIESQTKSYKRRRTMLMLVQEQLEQIYSLCHEYHVTRLEIFGSATRDDFDPNQSDIDILVEFVPETDLGPWMANFFALQERLGAVLGRKVDLVMAKAVHNPYVLRSINQDRRVLYAA
jgi:predicted nucleotidyltransferase